MNQVVSASLQKRYFWTVFAILSVATLLPFWQFRYPALADYPNHLARVYMLAGAAHDAWKQFYDVHFELIPNLALDIIVPLIVRLGLNPEHGLRIFAACSLMMPVIGTVVLAMQLQKTTPWVALLAFPLAMNRYFAWGFMNYFFSLGLALLLLAYWLRISRVSAETGERQAPGALKNRAGLVFLSIGMFGLLLSHLVGLVLFLITVLSYELFIVWRSRQKDWGPLTLFSLSALPALISYVTVFDHNEYGLQIYYYDYFLSKFAGLASPIYTYELIPALVTLAVLAVTGWIVVKVCYSRVSFAFGFLPCVVVLTLVFLAAPGAMMGSAFLDRRLFVFACFVALAAVRFDDSRQLSKVLVIAAVLLTTIRVVEVNTVWSKANDTLATIRKELLVVPPGARLVQHPILPLGLRDDTDVIRHASAFAVIDRGVFIPTLFAQPFNGESIRYLEKENRYFKASLGEPLAGPKDPRLQWGKICAAYDYVLLTGVLEGLLYPACVRTTASGPTFVLLEVIHKGGVKPLATK